MDGQRYPAASWAWRKMAGLVVAIGNGLRRFGLQEIRHVG